MGFKIIGTGSCLPEKIVTNDELSKILDTSDEWISKRTGIKSRRVSGDTPIFEIAAEACKRALESAGVKGSDIDLIIFSSSGSSYVTPPTSCLIKEEIGAVCSQMFDINMGCSGFIYSLDLAETYITAGKAERVLIVCGEKMTSLVDWTDRSMCVLFGDGAGAVVLEGSNDDTYISLKVDGDKELLCGLPPQGNSPFTSEKTNSYINMKGNEVYKFAVSNVSEQLIKALEDTGSSADDISLFLMHQANLRIIEAIRIRMKQPREKFPANMQNLGNTSSASIPILLDELNRNNQIQSGQKLALAAFGAGLTVTVSILKF